ncbi:4-hydroxybenzoyl-CoA reductase subunit beta [Rhodoplanes serenus]|uniref:4-hydroxybenzoyl-CoA reductase subunit beta n=1 Tax=Rhodoplanes serenus TaxID=200615 RepID=A0A447CXN1_9BRAD|nr:4-hydroxybenzoyl-CoA reductase subunit beta [Rhodoplanes serenus]MBI5110616.1 4-hydroxybenzoyl-CoA reductase subunit beta [Rhodovulum sp.]VCU10004.1 4-hydroxybenzoyl-CoA reductase subunit beta [Rhodoplanes serenus]
MTTLMPPFRLHRPASLAEAVATLSATPGGRPLAGGTDLLVNLRRGMGAPPALVDLTSINGLDRIDVGADGLVLGATVDLARLGDDPRVRAGWPALAQAAAAVAGPTHREAATLGGNLCQDTRCVFVNQSEWWRAANSYCLKVRGDTCHVVKKSERCYAVYAGDVAPALLVLGATVETAGRDGTRHLPLADLFREEGRTHLALEPGEVVTAIRVPPPDGASTGYRKVRVRDSIDFPLAGIAMSLRRSGDGLAGLRVALTGIASAPVLVPDLDTMLGRPWAEIAGPLAEAVRKGCNAVKTTVATPKYRRRVSAAAAVALGAELWAGQEESAA